jgi:hypothetical protein
MNDTKPIIESHIPIPGGRPRGRPMSKHYETIYDLIKADIGCSVLFPFENGPSKSLMTKINTYCWSIGGGGWYRIRTLADGVRVWKCAEPIKNVVPRDL